MAALCCALEGPGWVGRSLASMHFRRGFVHALRLNLESAHDVMTAEDEIEPLDCVVILSELADYRHAYMVAVAEWESGCCVNTLSVDGVSDSDVRAVVSAGRLTRLERLSFTAGSLTTDGVQELAASPLVDRLKVLDLRENQITDRGAFALAESPHLARVVYLALHGNPIGPAGRARLRERFGDRLKIESEGDS
jgi:hypothetical protein